MGPIADFSCLGPKCRTDGGAPVYADLPIASTRCPVCGSKRIQRLYNKAPGMIRPGGRALQHFIDQAGSEAQSVKSAGTDARLGALKREHPMLAVPMGKIAPTLAAMGASVGAGKAEVVARAAHPVLQRATGRTPVMQPGGMSRHDGSPESKAALLRRQA